MQNIYIIILHFGNIETTKKCLDSLARYEKTFDQIVLVNNDPAVTLSLSQFTTLKTKLRIINNKKNLGFAGGVNVGITSALEKKAEYVLLLNNDTLITSDIITPLATTIINPIGIAGPAIKFTKENKTLYDLGGYVNLLFGRTHHHEVEEITDKKAKVVPYVSGCCMLIKRGVFGKIGMFDERFFLYSEDVDFCLRAKKAGFSSAVVPSVTIFHELSKAEGNISPFSVYHQTRSGVIFGKKHCLIPLFNFLFLFAQSCLFFLKNNKAGMAAFRGLLAGLSS